MKSILATLLLVSSCFAQADQINFEVLNRKVTTGLVNPKIVGNAVMYESESDPQVLNAGFVKTDIVGPELELWVFGIEGQGFGDPRIVGPGEWIILGKGKYQVILQVIENGKSRKSSPKDLLITEIGPEPDPEPGPLPIPDETLSQTTKDARAVMRNYVAEMAADMEKLAIEVESKKYKTVNEASSAMNAFDTVTRGKFKSLIGDVMQRRLGSGNLPVDASKVFRDISVGYKGVK